MGFKTVHPEHAIVQTQMQVTTAGPLMEEERGKLNTSAQRWRSVLPKTETGQVLNIEIVPNGRAQPAERPPHPLSPTRFVHFGGDGQPDLWMALEGNYVSVGTTDYGGWTPVSRKFHQLLTMLGGTVAREHPFRKVRKVELTYHDRLIWTGERDTIEARKAIRPEWLPPARCRGDQMWHIEQGWTSDADDGVKMLEKCNVARLDELTDGKVRGALQVTTTAAWGFGWESRPPREEEEFDMKDGYANLKLATVPGGEAGETQQGWTVSNRLHEKTHELFAEVVTQEIAGQVGLRKA